MIICVTLESFFSASEMYCTTGYAVFVQCVCVCVSVSVFSESMCVCVGGGGVHVNMR